MSRPPVALVHDYLTQRGGAERVVLTLADAYPDAAIHTSLYDPVTPSPGFAGHDVRTLPLDRVGLLRDHHRLALPFLAPAFSHLHVDADVTICSSSGWAHGAQVSGAKIVYCHNPARWLYQSDQYLADRPGWPAPAWPCSGRRCGGGTGGAAATADRYLVNSRAVRARVAEVYGIDADVVPPPVDIDVRGPRTPVAGSSPASSCASHASWPTRTWARWSRRSPAARPSAWSSWVPARWPTSWPPRRPANVTILGRVEDEELRWLYGACPGLVAASYEDFGLTPVGGRRLRHAHRRPAVGRIPRHHRRRERPASSSTSPTPEPSPRPSTS